MTKLANYIERIKYKFFDEQVIFKPTPLRIRQRIPTTPGANTYTYPEEPVETDDDFKIQAILQYNGIHARYTAHIYEIDEINGDFIFNGADLRNIENINDNKKCNIFDRSLKTKTVKTIKKIGVYAILAILAIIVLLIIIIISIISIYDFADHSLGVTIFLYTIFGIWLGIMILYFNPINILHERQVAQYNARVFNVLSSVSEFLNNEKKRFLEETFTDADRNIFDHSNTNNIILGYLGGLNNSNSVINAVLLAYLKYDHRSGCRKLSTSELKKLSIRIYKDAKKYLAFPEPEPDPEPEPEPVRARSRSGIQTIHVQPRTPRPNNDPDQDWLNVDRAH
jgi:hypothetical protein